MDDNSSFHNKPLKEWNSKDISHWLASIGMKPYVSTFKNEKITGKHLCKFSEDDLRTKCKITARPIRKILFKRLKHVQGRWKGGSDDEIDENEEDCVEKDSRSQKEEETLKEQNDDCNEKLLSDTDCDNLKRVLTPPEAAFKIQSLFQCWRAHQTVVQLIQSQFIKIYSIDTGRYVYKYVGRQKESINGDKHCVLSRLAPSEPLNRKPFNLGSIDLKVHFTKELAICRVQLFARYCFNIKHTRRIARQQWRRIIEPISGKQFFFHPRTGIKSWMKPKVFGRERWDPMDIRLWTLEDVQFYFRKLQLRRFGVLEEVKRHKIDGELLLLLEEGDLSLLGVPDSHMKRVLNDIKRIDQNLLIFDLSLLRRRDRFRGHHQILQAAVIIQRNFRRFNAEYKFSKLMDALARKKKHCLTQDKIWWSEYRFQMITIFLESAGGQQKLTIPF